MTQQPRATLVLFDLVGTLVAASGGSEGVGTNYATMAARFGVIANPSALDAAFRAEFRPLRLAKDVAESRAEGSARERSHWHAIVKRVFARVGQASAFSPEAFESFFDMLYGHFATASAWSVFGDVEAALARLERRGVRLGLLTNFDTRVFALVASLGWASRFDPIVIPALVGAAKPDPAIFRAALERAGADASSAMYVGDLPEDDVEGAVGAGLRPVLIDREDRYADRPGVVRIASLLELDGLV